MNNSQTKKSIWKQGVNVFDDTEELDISKLNFDLAFTIMDNDDNPLTVDETYASIKLYKIEEFDDGNGNSNITVNMIPCPDISFVHKVQNTIDGLTYYCPEENSEWILKGDLFSKHRRYVYLGMYGCEGKTESGDSCKTEDEVNSYFDNLRILTYYKNFYFDFEDYSENPVKEYTVFHHDYRIQSLSNVRSTIKIIKSEVTLEDSIFEMFAPSKNLDFVRVENHELYEYRGSGVNEFSFYLQKDQNKEIYERRAFGILEAFGMIGGVFEFFFLILGIFLSWYTRN